ncbi:hypothetical protein [Francisella uliginis]|uniref:Uncharacterized protein n=1 Tax=Francisella uliginis TaxID=573570 RepID=A0A1L4BS67_9GAMM|nr:hypothetical protein [Francisella uliginis]API86681.1 hypothetical protein F7310_04600 [Francisella uliginis]
MKLPDSKNYGLTMLENINNYRKAAKKYKLYFVVCKMLRMLFLIVFSLFLLNSLIVLIGHNAVYEQDYNSFTAKIYSYFGQYTYYEYAYKFDSKGIFLMFLSLSPALVCFILEKVNKNKMYNHLGEVVKIEQQEKAEKQQERIYEMKSLYGI